MGLNMPARSVLFTTYVKHDGTTTRALTSGEYIQMSGRAGRRGKDDRGYVMMLVEDPDKFSPSVAKALVSGKPTPLMSRFKLSYYTLLNLSKRREGGMDHMEYLIAHSFQQYQHEQQVPRMRARLDEIEGQLAGPAGAGAFREDTPWHVMLHSNAIWHAVSVCRRESSHHGVSAVTPFYAPRNVQQLWLKCLQAHRQRSVMSTWRCGSGRARCVQPCTPQSRRRASACRSSLPAASCVSKRAPLTGAGELCSSTASARPPRRRCASLAHSAPCAYLWLGTVRAPCSCVH